MSPSSSRSPGTILLRKDGKLISPVKHNSRRDLGNFDIKEITKRADFEPSGLPSFNLRPACCNNFQIREWYNFTEYLQQNNRVAHVLDETCDFYILPPDNAFKVHYKMRCSNSESLVPESSTACTNAECVQKTYVMHPCILEHLSQIHSSSNFGAIAELVDNARDAKATKLEITIQSLKKDGEEIPVLSVIDNGHGMSHQELLRMFSLECKTPDKDDPFRIGIFGTGFKTGSMGIGQDAIVLTQTTESRSVGLLSQSFNMGKKILESPIISYCKEGPLMKVDTTVHSKAEAELALKDIQDYSHFNEYYIGALFHTQEVGTQIHIWNLNKCGPDYCLDWQDGKDTEPEGDIMIRSTDSRLHEGQISKKVPLEYSLRSYLEVIFLDSSMDISIQGSVVQPGTLVKALDDSVQIKSVIMGRPVELTLGHSTLEYDRKNCGIFLYWHGRLIEAYKRVGRMVHNAGKDLGIIGVIDVTDLMNGVPQFVSNDKQKFLRSAAYKELEVWLGQKAEEYSNKNPYKIKEKRISGGDKSAKKKCDKCQKWRFLGSFDISKLNGQYWYCYMPPYNRTCDYRQSPDSGETSVGSKRFRENIENALPGDRSRPPDTMMEYTPRKLKRLKRAS